MTRKLCSLLISSFAVLLLMGAGVEEDSAALVDESGSESVQTAAARVGAEEQAEPASAVSGECVVPGRGGGPHFNSGWSACFHRCGKDLPGRYDLCGVGSHVQMSGLHNSEQVGRRNAYSDGTQ